MMVHSFAYAIWDGGEIHDGNALIPKFRYVQRKKGILLEPYAS